MNFLKIISIFIVAVQDIFLIEAMVAEQVPEPECDLISSWKRFNLPWFIYWRQYHDRAF